VRSGEKIDVPGDEACIDMEVSFLCLCIPQPRFLEASLGELFNVHNVDETHGSFCPRLPLSLSNGQFLQAGAKIDDSENEGMTPLMLAARHNPNPEIISVLLQGGADGRTCVA